MHIPAQIQQHTAALPFEPITIGFSGDKIWRVGGEFYLKRYLLPERYRRELEITRWLSGRLPVPEVVCAVDSFDSAGWILTAALDGNMSHLPPFGEADAETSVRLLAEGLEMIKAVDIADCPFDQRLDVQLEVARKNVENGKITMEHWEKNNSFTSPEALLDWLERNRPPETLCFTHGDYCIPNIFFAADPVPRISGFVDLGLCGVADRWRDIAICTRTMGYNRINGDGMTDRLLEYLGIRRDDDMIHYYIMLDELF